MPRSPLSNCKYGYSHYDEKELSQAIDIHNISIQKSRKLILLSYFGTLLFLASSCYLFLLKEKLYSSSICSFFAVIIFAKFLQYKPIKKESVVIMPEFGVQLETHYWSGRISRHFVPIGKILRPVLYECVTPVTCYWSLALVLRGEEQLLLVFQKMQPPLKCWSQFGRLFVLPLIAEELVLLEAGITLLGIIFLGILDYHVPSAPYELMCHQVSNVMIALCGANQQVMVFNNVSSSDFAAAIKIVRQCSFRLINNYPSFTANRSEMPTCS